MACDSDTLTERAIDFIQARLNLSLGLPPKTPTQEPPWD